MPDKQPTAPAAKGIREPLGGLLRRPALFFDPMSLSAKHWRRLIGQAPVVAACIQTLIMQITGLQWTITGDDETAREDFTTILNMADNGGGFESLVARVVEDTLTVPFGGAIELGPYPDGQVAWLAHLDAALMSPTYDEKYPYMQSNPYDVLRPAVFKATEVARIMWQPQAETSLYGWTKTPCMACLPAIQGLLRSDRFWQTLLTDSPPAGILDIPGMTEDEARDWLSDWKTMMAGIDSLKVPILTGEGRSKESGPTQFISFGQDATQVQLPELLKRYSEQVCAAFGMNTSDLGLFGQEMRLAGMSKIIELSKRQGLARLLNQFERVINTDVLPEGLTFKWEDMELEDTVRREAAKKMSAERLAILANPMAPIITLDEARRQAAEEKLITVEGIDTPLDEAPPPEPPSGNGDKPKSDEGVTTTGAEKGDQAGARASPKGIAPLVRGASTEKVPPRANPANTPAGNEMGRIVGPWIKGIADSFTLARLGRLLDAGMKAWASAPVGRAAPVTPGWLRQKYAEDAIEAILATENWWKAPDIVPQVEAAFAKGYADTLVESAEEMQTGLYNAGFSDTPQIPFSSATLTDPGTLASLKAQAGSMIQNVDAGTKFFVKQTVLAGVKEGMGSKAIARKLLVNNVRRGVIEKFRGRALSIVNTEMNTAMTASTLAQQQSVGLKKKRWRAVAALACDFCKRNEARGAVRHDYPYESVWGAKSVQGPPAHPTVCLHGDSRVMAQGVAAATKRWYNGEMVVIGTAGGHHLRCTPNHPILTDCGWVPAGLLVEGGYVVSSLSREWMAARDPNHDDVPARIEEIAEAFARPGEVTAREVPTSAEDFHGDGVGSEVAVVYADGLLGDDVQTVVDKHGRQRHLCRRHRQLAGLDGQGRLDARVAADGSALTLARELAAPNSVVGGLGKGPALLGRGSSVAAPLALAEATDGHSAGLQSGLQGIPAYPIPSAEAIERIAGQVALDKIVHVDKIANFAGHVYNLQTADGFYVADGIVTHNCHCWITHDRADLLKAAGVGKEPNYWQGGPLTAEGLPEAAGAAEGLTPIDDWTPKTFRKEFAARFDTELYVSKAEGDLPWTLQKAQKVGRVWETMPTPPRAKWGQMQGYGKEGRLRIRIQPKAIIQRLPERNDWSAYYRDWRHEIVYGEEHTFGAAGLRTGRFGLRGGHLNPDPWDYGHEAIAHELGHAYAYAKWGKRADEVADVTAMFRRLKANAGAAGWKYPSWYGQTKPGEMIAENWAWLRADATAFKRQSGTLYEKMVEWFGWEGNLRPGPFPKGHIFQP